MSLQEQKHFTFHHLTQTHQLSKRNTNLLNRSNEENSHGCSYKVCPETYPQHPPLFGFHTLHCSVTRGGQKQEEDARQRLLMNLGEAGAHPQHQVN